MSVINVSFLSESEILIQSDTLQYLNGKPLGLCKSKVHIGNGFACGQRGLVEVCEELNAVMTRCVGLDHVVGTCAEILRNNAAFIVSTAARFFPTAPASHQMLFGGWSRSRNRMVVCRIDLDGRGVRVSSIDAPGETFVIPEMKPGMRVPAANGAQLIRLALNQSRILQFAPGMCIGGVIHVTAVRPDSVKQIIAGLYPNYEEYAALRGDPNADEVREYLRSVELAA